MGIDTAQGFFEAGDIDRNVGFYGAELFEFFDRFQRAWGHFLECFEGLSAVGIEPNMVIDDAITGHHGASGEIVRSTAGQGALFLLMVPADDGFDDMGIVAFFCVMDGGDKGGDGHMFFCGGFCFFRSHGVERAEGLGCEGWHVALDVDDPLVCFFFIEECEGLGDSVASTGERRVGHDGVDVACLAELSGVMMVACDDDVGDLCLLGMADDVGEHGRAVDVLHNFVFEACGVEAGGDDDKGRVRHAIFLLPSYGL